MMSTIYSVVTILMLLVLMPANTFAQVTSSSIAEQLQLSEAQPNGTLLCNGRDGLIPCQGRYLSSLYGIVTTAPAGELVSPEITNGSFISRDGVTQVRVSNVNGAIVHGDLVTSSQVAGVAMKADRNGYVLGSALEGYDQSEEGIIKVAINIHPTTVYTDSGNNLLELLRDIVNAPILTPLATLRYLLAALVTLVSFILGFRFFGTIARTGVESIGRNPLARNTIYSTVILNIIIMIVIFISGLMLSFLILTL